MTRQGEKTGAEARPSGVSGLTPTGSKVALSVSKG